MVVNTTHEDTPPRYPAKEVIRKFTGKQPRQSAILVNFGSYFAEHLWKAASGET